MPFGPALPKGVRTPSTKTTSRSERGRRSPDDTGPPQQFGTGRREARLSTSYPRVTLAASAPPPRSGSPCPIDVPSAEGVGHPSAPRGVQRRGVPQPHGAQPADGDERQ